MPKTELLNLYRCTLVSDKEVRRLLVAAPSFGKAAKVCIDSISSWENKESYELVNIRLLDICSIKKDL